MVCCRQKKKKKAQVETVSRVTAREQFMLDMVTIPVIPERGGRKSSGSSWMVFRET